MNFKKFNNEKYNQILIYLVVAFILILSVKYLFDNLNMIAAIISTFITWIMKFLIPLFWGIFIAYLLKPLMNMYKSLLDKYKVFPNYTKIFAVFLTAITVFLFFATLFSLLMSVFANRLLVFNVQSFFLFLTDLYKSMQEFYHLVLHYLDQLQIRSDFFNPIFEEARNFLSSPIISVGSGFLSSAATISNFISTFIFSVIFSLYFLGDGVNITKYWSNAFRIILGNHLFEIAQKVLQQADHILAGYLRGQILDALFMSVSTSIVLSVVGVKFALVIGIFSGLGNLVPYLGPFIAYISTALICAIQGEWTILLIAMLCLLFLQAIDANVIGPRLIGSNVDIHPVVVVTSLLIGENVAGILGMFFAVPIAALLKLFFDQFLLKRQSKFEDE